MELCHKISPPTDPPYATFPTSDHTFSPHNHTSSTPSSHPVPYRYTYKVVHYRYLQIHLRKDNNGSFLLPSRMNPLPRDCFPDNPAKNNDTSCRSKKQLGNTIFIDHIAQIIGSCGCATYLMYSPEFRTVSTISIGNSTAI